MQVVAWTKRVAVALAGGACASVLVALVEARSCMALVTGSHGPAFVELVLAEVGVLAPVALGVAFFVGVVAVFLESDRPHSWREHVAEIRAQPVLARTRTAAVAPLAVLVGLGWVLVTANLARTLLARGAPLGAGVELALGSLGVFFSFAVCGLAALPTLRRALATGAARWPRLLDPVATGSAAVAIALAVLAAGVSMGDAGGDASGAVGSVLGVFGVLKRPELDLRPVVDLLAMAVAAYVAPIVFARHRCSWGRFAIASVLAVIPFLVTAREAFALGDEPAVARLVERSAPLGRVALGMLRKATDRDHDGASALFGGGDCDDHDPRRSPTAVDVPGNGIDEDCSGADLPAPPVRTTAAASAEAEATASALPKDLNLILITIDTLRADELGSAGYPKPATPNLDRLAQKSVVFDRMYAMASYTGKSLGPMMIGKYPSETLRNGAHFNTYSRANTFLAERFTDAGIRTFGAASHWYFQVWSGLTQGFAEWDVSAKPPSGQGDTDTSVTSNKLSDAALRMLDEPENTKGRFYLWVHYFDPHAQYEPHEGAPDFLEGAKGANAANRAAYDGEVWFTDEQVGRLLDRAEKEPWGKKTAIVVTADHGEAFADHGMSWHGVEIWESLMRVPFLVYVPGLTPHHVPLKRSHIDMVPTLLDVMGVAQPKAGELSGQSMIDDLVKTSGGEERDVYIDMPVGPYTQMRRAIIHGPTPGMKLIHFGGNLYNLFDLANDPGEKEDLANDKAQFQEAYRAMQTLRSGLKEIEVKPEGGDQP